jgi:hypothetical protein
MKGIVLILFFLGVWALFGHWFSLLYLSSNVLVIPNLIWYLMERLKNDYSFFAIVPLCFTIVLANDYLFRVFGGGNHDEVGKVICDLIFYIILFVVTIMIIVRAFKLVNKQYSGQKYIDTKHGIITYIILCSAVTYLLFSKLNILF